MRVKAIAVTPIRALHAGTAGSTSADPRPPLRIDVVSSSWWDLTGWATVVLAIVALGSALYAVRAADQRARVEQEAARVARLSETLRGLVEAATLAAAYSTTGARSRHETHARVRAAAHQVYAVARSRELVLRTRVVVRTADQMVRRTTPWWHFDAHPGLVSDDPDPRAAVHRVAKDLKAHYTPSNNAVMSYVLSDLTIAVRGDEQLGLHHERDVSIRDLGPVLDRWGYHTAGECPCRPVHRGGSRAHTTDNRWLRVRAAFRRRRPGPR